MKRLLQCVALMSFDVATNPKMNKPMKIDRSKFNNLSFLSPPPPGIYLYVYIMVLLATLSINFSDDVC